MRRRHLILGGLSAFLTGCGRSRERVIGVIPKATSHLFFVSVHAGVQKASADFHVSILWNGPLDETDYTRQIEIVDAGCPISHSCPRLTLIFCRSRSCSGDNAQS